MKIFVHVTARAFNKFILDKQLFKQNFDYNQCLRNLLSYGSTSMLGINQKEFPDRYFVCFSNSFFLQQKWAHEQNLAVNENWETEILTAQMEAYKPDVLFTVNPSYICSKSDQLPDIPLKAFWRAAPVNERIDYGMFDLALTYAERYRNLLHQAGVSNVELHQFSFDASTIQRMEQQTKETDITFVGTYNTQFHRRNDLLKSIAKKFIFSQSITYFLQTKYKWKGLMPDIPLTLLPVYHKPVYLRKMLMEYIKSRIVFNCHSDIARQAKGNMRVFEALGTKSFMLTDAGNYPRHFVAGTDFITYTDKDDLFKKINYYLAHPDEREKIAQNGYERLKKHYDVSVGSRHLKAIFSKYL